MFLAHLHGAVNTVGKSCIVRKGNRASLVPKAIPPASDSDIFRKRNQGHSLMPGCQGGSTPTESLLLVFIVELLPASK